MYQLYDENFQIDKLNFRFFFTVYERSCDSPTSAVRKLKQVPIMESSSEGAGWAWTQPSQKLETRYNYRELNYELEPNLVYTPG